MRILSPLLFGSAVLASCIPPDGHQDNVIVFPSLSESIQSEIVQSERAQGDKIDDEKKWHEAQEKDDSLERILALAKKLGEEQEDSDARKNNQYLNSGLLLREIIADYENKHPHGRKHRKIIIEKSERRLSLYLDDKLLKQYPVGLHVRSHGDKEREGDGQTPEGTFYISSKLLTRFYKSLLISYPSKEDAERGLKDGLISRWQYRSILSAVNSCKTPLQKTSLGGEILIHGGGGSYDWTAGCIALDNKDMDEVYSFAQTGCICRNIGKGGYAAIPRTLLIITK